MTFIFQEFRIRNFLFLIIFDNDGIKRLTTQVKSFSLIQSGNLDSFETLSNKNSQSKVHNTTFAPVGAHNNCTPTPSLPNSSSKRRVDFGAAWRLVVHIRGCEISRSQFSNPLLGTSTPGDYPTSTQVWCTSQPDYVN